MSKGDKTQVPQVVTEDPLTTHELNRKRVFEEEIERAMMAPFEVGSALKSIRDERLFRDEYPTLNAYCEDKWNIKRGRANQLILAADALKNLQDCKILPQNERQVRPLLELGGPLQKQAWNEVVQKSPEKITADIVRKVVERFTGNKKAKKKESKPTIVDQIKDTDMEEHEDIFDASVTLTYDEIVVNYNNFLKSLIFLVRMDRFKVMPYEKTIAMVRAIVDLAEEAEQVKMEIIKK